MSTQTDKDKPKQCATPKNVCKVLMGKQQTQKKSDFAGHYMVGYILGLKLISPTVNKVLLCCIEYMFIKLETGQYSTVSACCIMKCK